MRPPKRRSSVRQRGIGREHGGLLVECDRDGKTLDFHGMGSREGERLRLCL